MTAGAPRAQGGKSRGRRGHPTPTVLTIAGSDSSGGAGIQADLKAFASCGVHGTSAITAVTAQNTVGVRAIEPIAPVMILAQVRAVLEDIRVDAVKVGMLGTAQGTLAVARALDELPRGTPVVVDPVMVAESGARLLDLEAERALVEEILPRTSVLTPNLLEARVLAGRPARRAREDDDTDHSGGGGGGGDGEGGGGNGASDSDEREEVEALARALLELGPSVVVITGGHRKRAVDLLLDASDRAHPVEIAGERYPDGAAHGSGCTHSSLLAAQLALGRSPLQAARTARALTGEAVRAGLREIGAGAGPVDVIGLARLRHDAARLPAPVEEA